VKDQRLRNRGRSLGPLLGASLVAVLVLGTSAPATPAAQTCDGLSPTRVGTEGADTLTGTKFADIILALGGDDAIRGMDGNDRICGGDGSDDILGDAGKDRLFGGLRGDRVDGGPGEDLLEEPALDRERNFLLGGSGDEVSIDGGSGDDEIWGEPGDDHFLVGNSGNDLIRGDRFAGHQGEDSLFGGEGDDYMLGGGGDDVVKGGPDADEMRGQEGADRQFGEAGGDDVAGGTGADRLQEAGTDVATNTLDGGPGSDEVDGGSGSDEIIGGGGDDSFLIGGPGDDGILGEGGRDGLSGEEGADTLAGGADRDKLDGGKESDELLGGASSDRLLGDDGDDQLSGGGGGDRINAGGDTDVCNGGGGGDSCDGGPPGHPTRNTASDPDTCTAERKRSCRKKGSGPPRTWSGTVRGTTFSEGVTETWAADVTFTLVDGRHWKSLGVADYAETRVTITGRISGRDGFGCTWSASGSDSINDPDPVHVSFLLLDTDDDPVADTYLADRLTWTRDFIVGARSCPGQPENNIPPFTEDVNSGDGLIWFGGRGPFKKGQTRITGSDEAGIYTWTWDLLAGQ
jgi:Ca2+-binding RTX toxin-like protein